MTLGQTLHRIVEVHWEDAHSVHGWSDVKEVPTTCNVWSLGYVITDDDAAIVLVERVAALPETADLGCMIAIPRSQVRSVRELGEGGVEDA